MSAGHATYAVLGLVGSYLGIYFYLRVIQLMFMSADAAVAGEGGRHRLAFGATVACLLAALLVAVFPGWVIGGL
jgi:NADH-quinone oxidoreductase subunit N